VQVAGKQLFHKLSSMSGAALVITSAQAKVKHVKRALRLMTIAPVSAALASCNKHAVPGGTRHPEK
jgi:hypothetical protein